MNLNETKQEETQFVPNIQKSKQLFKKLKKSFEKFSPFIDPLIMPFITLKTLKVYSNKNKETQDFCLGYYLKIDDLNKITIQSFGLEAIFVVPKSNKKAALQFGTFKTFYYMISLFTNSHEDKGIKSLIEELKNQNEDIIKQWIDQMLPLQVDEQEGKNSVNAFISAMKQVFFKDDEYLKKLKEIFQIQCAIIKLIDVNNSRQVNPNSPNETEAIQKVQCEEEDNITFSQVFTTTTDDPEQDDENILQVDQHDQQTSNKDRNQTQNEILSTDQLYNIFKDLLGVELNVVDIKALLTNYTGTASYIMNSNRIIGFAQFLYSTLIKSFFHDVGQACKGISQDRQGEATFFRFPDSIIGGTQPNPSLSNCYFINLQRDLMKCWLETIHNRSVMNEDQLKQLEENTKQLRKKNDQQSIKVFFESAIIKRKFGSNLLVQIGHKSENGTPNYTTIYDLDDFCNVNKFDIDESDKYLLKTSKSNLISNQLKKDNQEKEVPSVVSEILQNYTKIQNIKNKFYIYEIGNKSLYKFLNDYIDDIKEQQSQDKKSVRQLANNYSQGHSEGTSSDEAPNLDSLIQH